MKSKIVVRPSKIVSVYAILLAFIALTFGLFKYLRSSLALSARIEKFKWLTAIMMLVLVLIISIMTLSTEMKLALMILFMIVTACFLKAFVRKQNEDAIDHALISTMFVFVGNIYKTKRSH
jgi:FtsH-binding integral membrane protein